MKTVEDLRRELAAVNKQLVEKYKEVRALKQCQNALKIAIRLKQKLECNPDTALNGNEQDSGGTGGEG